MSSALLLVGSPRGRKSTSTSIGQYVIDLLGEGGFATNTLWLREQVASEAKIDEMLDAVDASDIVVLTAPLYDDCQPYIVTRAMEAIHARGSDLGTKRFFPIINSGFPEHQQITAAAIPIYRCFADTVGFAWAGSLAISAGEMVRGSAGVKLDDIGKMAEPVRARLRAIADALLTSAPFPDDAMAAVPAFLLKPLFAKLMMRMNNSGWKKRATSNNADVAARPYDPA